ncbi:phosphotransferase [Chthoniobacter flavus]|nr:phosphotransferase [Chthoniobacter flavus]
MSSNMEEDRRHPRRQLDPALIASYLAGRKIELVQLMPLGKSNTNYRLTLADGEVCLLRLHHPGANAERENHILRLVREIVPVPAVLASGSDWSIHSFVEGIPLADAPESVHAAAEALARIASLRFTSSGWIQADGSIAPFDFGDGKSFVESMLERADVRAWVGADTAAALRRIEAAQPPAADDEPRLVHGDFNPTNILVHQRAVTGILDWEFSHAGSPYMDIGNLLRHTDPAQHGALEAGLVAGGLNVPADWRQQAEMVDLSSHLEFLTTQRSDAFKQRCADWIRDFVERY